MISLPLPASLTKLKRLAPNEWKTITASEPKAAANWMRRGAKLGNSDAQTVLGQWLLAGHALERNPTQALAWFLKAAVQGHPMAMNMAGRCFENGLGEAPDNFVAANWYGKAANLGHPKSMTKIGHYYEDGVVVVRDVDAALFAFGEGARGGDFRGAVQLCKHAGSTRAHGRGSAVATQSATDRHARLSQTSGRKASAIPTSSVLRHRAANARKRRSIVKKNKLYRKNFPMDDNDIDSHLV
jgi:TPR repeat protein